MFDLIIDTETAPTHKSKRPDGSLSLVYDMGGVVRNTKTGEIVHSFSFVIADTFYNNRMMQSAYYAHKLPQYHAGIASNDWLTVSFKYAYDYINSLISSYGIRTVWAYNAKFDIATLDNSIYFYSNGWIDKFFPATVTLKDIWARCSNITGSEKFVQYCFDNGYLSEKGNPQTKAEIVYRFLTQNDDFIEAHTARSDAEIEAYILTCAQHNKKKARRGIGDGWRAASATAKAMRSNRPKKSKHSK